MLEVVNPRTLRADYTSTLNRLNKIRDFTTDREIRNN